VTGGLGDRANSSPTGGPGDTEINVRPDKNSSCTIPRDHFGTCPVRSRSLSVWYQDQFGASAISVCVIGCNAACREDNLLKDF